MSSFFFLNFRGETNHTFGYATIYYDIYTTLYIRVECNNPFNLNSSLWKASIEYFKYTYSYMYRNKHLSFYTYDILAIPTKTYNEKPITKKKRS